MDIEILLALQRARQSLGSFVEGFFVAYSDAAMVAGLVVCAIVYWCVHKRIGQFALLCFSFGNWINQFVKNIACVYRPWLLDSRLMPSPKALGGATGYSFPSGHTVTSSTTFGSVAWKVRRSIPVVSIVFVVGILLVAFSRCFLGVHTPQDVIVGLAEAAIVVVLGGFAYSRYETWCEASGKNRDALVLLGVLVLCIVCVVVIEVKPYPMDYSDGVLLVDPDIMQRDCYEGVGVFAGMFLGWYCERRWVRFDTVGISVGERIVRGVIGFVVVVAIFYGFDIVAKAVLDPALAKLASRLVAAFVAMFVVPLLFAPLHKAIANR